MIPANVTQVTVSSNRPEDGSVFSSFSVELVRWKCGKREAFSKRTQSASLPLFVVAANSAGVRSANDEWVRLWL